MSPPLPMLADYLRRFERLRVAVSRQHGEAPYKPALLLAVLEGVAEGSIQHNQVCITPELVAAFTAICTDLGTSRRFTANNFALPFFHLRGDGFWHLHPHPGQQFLLTASGSIRSFGHLRDTLAYASLDPVLWQLVADPGSRAALRQVLLARYFPQTQGRYRARAGQLALADLRHQLLEEPAARYRARLDLGNELDLVVRSALFKREVLAAYHHTCAVSGLRLVSTDPSPHPLLDACHIVPWSQSHDDTIGNGIALCPNLHRAFDRHLFWIDTDYRVRVADSFAEFSGADYGLRRFQGQQLRLPDTVKWWPDVGNLARQRGESM